MENIRSFVDVKTEINRLLIKQEFEDRKNGQPKVLKVKKTDLLKTCIKLIDLVQKYFTE